MKDPRKILLALDLGKMTDALVEKARSLAKCFSAEIIPAHAVEITALYSGSAVVDMQGIYKQIYSQLGEVKNSLVQNGVSVGEVVIKDGNPEKVILEISEKLDIDLIILGAKKKNFVERLMGSTAEHVIRNSPKPVLCIHPQDPLGEMENILCALDGSSSSAHTLDEALNFCRLLKGKLHILHIIPYAKYYPSLGELRSPLSEWGHDVIPDAVKEYQVLETEIDQQEEIKFKNFLEDFNFSGVEHTHSVCRGYAGDQIIQQIKEKGCDLLIMGAADQKEVTTFFSRGTIEKVLRKVPCSILTIKHLKKQKTNVKSDEVEAVYSSNRKDPIRVH